ncbi:MAG: hypothetical protein J7L08_03485, partial [Candidatus Aenigmarchaeota archaeon]|nr:hypothetical protein [Candidatus Aenigmarchaeota archaeon]
MFKKYDIRGIYPDQINEKISYKLGRSIGTYFDGISFGVGRDTRDTSKKIEEHLIKGLMDSGSDVNYIGVSTTPIMSFYSMKENKKSLEITASHNPKEYTGIKFFSEDGMPFNNFEGIKEIFESKNFIDAKGNFKNIEDFGENYVDKFTKKFHSNLTVVVDTLGGAASYYCPKSLERIG